MSETEYASDTSTLSVPVRCTTVVFLANKFTEIISPFPDYTSPANRGTSSLPRFKETLSPAIWGKTGGPTKIE